MTLTAPTHRPPVAARRVGYGIAMLVNAALLYAANVWPGWQALPFLTSDAGQVLGLVNLSLAVGLVANLAYLASDAPWLTSLGGLLTTGIGLVVLVRVLQVFPFAFRDAWLDGSLWSSLARVALVVAIVGSAIAMIVQVVALVRQAVEGAAVGGPGRPGR